MLRLIGAAVVLLCSSDHVFGQTSRAKPDPQQQQMEQTQVQSLIARMGGGPKVWWVVNSQYIDGTRKERGHHVASGTEAAAKMIVEYARGKSARSLRVNWEAYNTEQEARARVSWWQQYDYQAGYR